MAAFNVHCVFSVRKIRLVSVIEIRPILSFKEFLLKPVCPFVEWRQAKIDQKQRGRLEGTVNSINNSKVHNYLYNNTC